MYDRVETLPQWAQFAGGRPMLAASLLDKALPNHFANVQANVQSKAQTCLGSSYKGSALQRYIGFTTSLLATGR